MNALPSIVAEIETKPSIKNRMINIFKKITIEPVLLIFNAALMISVMAAQSLVVRKYCLIDLGYSKDVCLNLTANKTLEDETQEFTSMLITYKTILDTLPSVLWALVIGPWSDKNGRLALLIFPTIGATIGVVVLLITSIYESEIGAYYILIATVPLALSGGLLCLQTGTFSYLADVTKPEERTTRFAIAQATNWLGVPVGSITTSLLYEHFDLVALFSVSTGMYVACVLYTLIFLKETVKSSLTFREKCYSLFDFKIAKQGVASLQKKRSNHDRLHIFLLIATAGIAFLPIFAEFNTIYLYARWKFQWNLIDYSNYSLFYNLSTGIGLLVVLPIMSSIFKVKDVILGLISCVSKIILELIIATSSKSWMLFAATPVSIFAGMIGALTRTIISKIVSSEEQATFLSIINTAECVAPTIGVVTFTALYNLTRTTFPAAVFYFSAALAVPPTIFLLWIFIQRHHAYQSQLNSSDNEISPDKMSIN